MKRSALAAVTIVTAMLTVGACGSREDAQPAATADATPAPVAPAVPLIAPDRLLALLPAADGWQQSDVKSAGLTLPAPATHATATYTRGSTRADLAITDTAGHAEFLEATLTVAGTSFLQKAANGYQKGATVAGFPAIEAWNHQDRLGEFTIVVNRRFLIYVTATGLDSLETLRGLVDRIDFPAVASLGQAPGR